MIPLAEAIAARRAFTMVETAIASLIVAVMLAAAVSLSGAAGLAQYKTAERATAGALADAMVAEIAGEAYSDPQGNPVFGLEAGEIMGVRSTYDDVDDYNGLDETAPADQAGTTIPGLVGWERLVSVCFTAAASPDTVSVPDVGLKRIIVTIKHNGATVLTRRTLRSNAL